MTNVANAGLQPNHLRSRPGRFRENVFLGQQAKDLTAIAVKPAPNLSKLRRYFL
jgi:hypothetical protein